MHTSGQNSQRVEKFLGLCDTGTLGAVVPKGATIRLRGCRNARVDGIKVEVQVKLGMFKQTLCQVAASPSLGCFLRLVIMSNWEDFTTQYWKTKSCWWSPKGAIVGNARVGGTKANAWMKIGMFEQFLCEAVASIFTWMCFRDGYFVWLENVFPPSSIIKQ